MKIKCKEKETQCKKGAPTISDLKISPHSLSLVQWYTLSNHLWHKNLNNNISRGLKHNKKLFPVTAFNRADISRQNPDKRTVRQIRSTATCAKNTIVQFLYISPLKRTSRGMNETVDNKRPEFKKLNNLS